MVMDQGMTPERNQAYHKFRQAQVEDQKGHYEKALSVAKEGLQLDPTYIELAHWIAELHLKHNEPRKASADYQEIIHHHRDDEKAWAALRKIDPAAADRLDRAAHMAPDPFMVKNNIKAGAAEEDLQLEEVEGFDVLEGEESGGPAFGSRQLDSDEFANLADVEGDFEPLMEDSDALEKHDRGDMLADMDELGDQQAEAEVEEDSETVTPSAGQLMDENEDWALEPETAEPTPQTAAAPQPVAVQEAQPAPAVAAAAVQAAPVQVPAIAPSAPPVAADLGIEHAYPWEHEQDRPLREKLMQKPVFKQMVEQISAAWVDDDEWETVHGHCAHADPKQHPDIFQAALQAAARLNLSKPDLFIVPERFTQPEVFRGTPVQIAVPTGILRGFDSSEKVFVMGRWLGAVASGMLAYLQACHVVIDRKVRIEDCAMAIRARLENITLGWQSHIEKDQIPKLKALCHAWEQRAVLSSDRAGLVCCQDLEAACRGIAKGTAKYADDALKISTERFLSEFEGQDVGQLAAIPIDDGPCSSRQYAVYRIAMLRWWAGTEEGQALI